MDKNKISIKLPPPTIRQLPKYNLAIFDLDGTILNTLDDLTDSVNFALHSFDLPLRSREEVRSFVGNGMQRLIALSVPQNRQDIANDVYNTFVPYYNAHCLDKTIPYDGIVKLFDMLKKQNMHLAVISNKAEQATKTICDKFFKGTFDIIIGQTDGREKKPSPNGIFEVLDKLNISKQNAVYIGDSEVDLLTAQNAQIDCIIVSWGFRDIQTFVPSTQKVAFDTDQLYTELSIKQPQLLK